MHNPCVLPLQRYVCTGNYLYIITVICTSHPFVLYSYIASCIERSNHYIILHVGVLKSSGDKMTVKFHTSTDKEPKVYTITTMGKTDTVLSLLG